MKIEESKKKATLTVYPMTCSPLKAYHVPYDMSKKKAKTKMSN